MDETITRTESSPADQPAPRHIALRPLTLAGLLLAAALLPLVVALWLTRAPAEGGAEVLFARDMSYHHQQAVEMALIIRDRTQDESLRTFATDIVLTQQAQIGQMSGWLAAWGRPLSGDAAPMGGMGLMMGMAAQGDVNALRTLPVPEAEVKFLQLMTLHHQGGVFMAKDALKATARPEVVRMAQSIIAGQQNEIGLMRELLAARGAKPLPDLQPMTH
jgi:uncharacterized protein (DUF305 family)